MPLVVMIVGIVGIVPVIVCGLGAIGPGTGAADMLAALIGYCAVVLAFLGGMQWGFALRPVEAGGQAQPWRLVLGVVPPLAGWVALLAALVLWSWLALLLLAAGFITTVVAEYRWAQHGMAVPAGYLWLRWGLTAVIVAMLVTVLTLRLLGVTVLVM